MTHPCECEVKPRDAIDTQALSYGNYSMFRRWVMTTRRAITVLAAASAFMSLLPAVAGAAEFNSLMVFPYQPVYGTVPDEVANKTTELVQSEVGNSDKIKLVQSPKLETAALPASEEASIDQAAIKKAMGHVKAGAGELKSQNFDKAIKVLKDALRVRLNHKEG